MGVSVGKSGDTKSDPNVVPFCDILLVLLIIFMVITPAAQQGMDIKLPEVSSSGPDQPTTRIPMLIVKKDPNKPKGLSIALYQEEIPYNLLFERMRTLFAGRPDKRIFVRAGADVRFQDVVDIIDLVKSAGAETVALVPVTAD